MAASPYAAKLAAYSSASAHGGVAAADPHKLILMLMDGALERIATARGCMERKETAEKARLINRTVSIIGELRSTLDMNAGGQIAANLARLYDYMNNCLLKANLDNSVKLLDEVSRLLHDIRDAWGMIPADARNVARGAR
jgi:flagellar protein FliS